MTDEAAVYKKLGEEFVSHGSTNHSAGEYVKDDGFTHTNTVDGYFALLKPGIYGQFHNISEAHLHRYLSEADFKYNTRHLSDAERREGILKGAKGKRLTYRQPDHA
jgi:hypothetical protein